MAAERPRKRPRRTTEGNDTSGGKSKAQKRTQGPRLAVLNYTANDSALADPSLTREERETQYRFKPYDFVRFYVSETDPGAYVDIRVEDGELSVMTSNGGLCIRPIVSNHLVIEHRPHF